MDYAKLILIAAMVFCAGTAFAVDVPMYDLLCGSDCGAVSTPQPGQVLKGTVVSASEQTAIINRYQCGDDSSFSIDTAGGGTLLADVQTCKEPSGALVDCEDDSNAGTASVGNYAFIRQGTYVRVDYTLGTAGDLIYFDCSKP